MDFEEQANRNVVGINYYLDEVLYKYRKCSVGDQQAPKDAEIEFENPIKDSDFDDGIYFKLIFQQAFIRSWAMISNRISKYNIPIMIATNAFIDSLDVLVFKKNSRYFDPAHIYTQNILFDGQRIIQNESSRKAWIGIILSSLITDAVRKRFILSLGDSIENRKEIDLYLLSIGKEYTKLYLESLFEILLHDYKKNWRHKDLPREKTDLLEIIEKDPKEIALFNSTIEALATGQLNEAKKSFKSILSTDENI